MTTARRRRAAPQSLALEVAVLTERVRGLEALVAALRERAEAAEARAQAVAESPKAGAGFSALAPSKLAELEAAGEDDRRPVHPALPSGAPVPDYLAPDPRIRWLAPPPKPAAPSSGDQLPPNPVTISEA